MDYRTDLRELAFDPAVKPLVKGCDLTKKPRSYSDKKMAGHAHNAIIPSTGVQNIKNLTS